MCYVFFFKQKTAYEMRISDWSSDVCSSDLFDRLRGECGFTGGYTIIKDYMREREQRRQEVFVPLSHPPGHAQADFGEAMVVIGGVEQKARFFVLDLPHSDGCYVRAYPAAVAEARSEEHTSELQSLMRISYAVFCLKNKNHTPRQP